MKILLLNGSPRGWESCTMTVTNAFVEGLLWHGRHPLQTVDICDRDIQPCRGCFACWTATPGRCVIEDDMPPLLTAFRSADLVIWSFPLYCFGMPSDMKAFTDRLMPNNLPFFTATDKGGTRHPKRYDAARQRHVLISTCGFHTLKDNYEALEMQFDMLFGGRNLKIFCPQGGSFGASEPSRPVRELWQKMRRAGEEFARTGTLTENTLQNLSRPVFDPDTFMKVMNRLWSPENAAAPDQPPDAPQDAEARESMAQLISAFTPPSAEVRSVVLEIYFTDLRNTFRLRMENGACSLDCDERQAFTTRIEIPFAEWKEIVGGRTGITQAFLEEKCKIMGDFDTILRIDDLFPIKP